MDRMPKVSVIVPCYNLGAFVEEAVDSVLAQTYQEFEIVVVNDGSTDPRTNEVLANLKRPRTRVFATKNQGLPAARNFAIGQTSGEYLCALDADDKLHPEFLEKTISVLEQQPNVTFVSTWVECFGAESWTWRQERCDFPTLLAECVVLTASPVRRAALDAVGGYNSEAYLHGSEDWDLWISLVGRGFLGAIVPEVLFYYRQREGSMRRFAERGEVRLRVWRTLLERHRELYERYLPEVLLLKEDECGAILRANWLLQHELESSLQPAIAVRRATLAGLQGAGSRAAEAAALQRSLIDSTRALEAAEAEVGALRSSRSWAVTAPLRRSYEAWLALRSRFSARSVR